MQGSALKNVKMLQQPFQGIGSCYRLNTFSGIALWTHLGISLQTPGTFENFPKLQGGAQKRLESAPGKTPGHGPVLENHYMFWHCFGVPIHSLEHS